MSVFIGDYPRVEDILNILNIPDILDILPFLRRKVFPLRTVIPVLRIDTGGER